MSECVEHLHSALRAANEEYLFSARVLLDSPDQRNVIIDAHLRPRPRPELWLVDCETNVLLRILRAPIIANPNVIARLSKL